ncbi:MAG: hypothetical protein V4466_14000 [Pseudomonadota bacterium]
MRLSDPSAPWLLYAPGGILDTIAATAELDRWMPEESGYFLADEMRSGWRIRGPAPDQSWI